MAKKTSVKINNVYEKPTVVSSKDKKNEKAGLFIPAGLLLGLGFGFLFKNVPAWLFLGLGAGFLFFALAKNKK
ncbi:MAG: hypothetical protein ACP5N2_00930 [Candidatus Nanoarchaeia archaeon]